MARTDSLYNFLTDVADSIRSKKGTTESIIASEFDTEIESIESNKKYAPSFISFYNFKGTDLTYELENLDTSNVIDMSYMFFQNSNIESLDLGHFNTSNVKDMNNMFNNSNKLKTLILNNFNIIKVESLDSTFRNLTSITDLDLSSFSNNNVKTVYGAFYGCDKMKNLNIGNFDMSKIISTNIMLSGCSSLEILNFGLNLGKGYTKKENNYYDYSIALSGSSKLTHDSAMSIINNVYDLNLTYDVENGGTLYTQKLQLGATTLAKLTAEEISLGTVKGWSIS